MICLLSNIILTQQKFIKNKLAIKNKSVIFLVYFINLIFYF